MTRPSLHVSIPLETYCAIQNLCDKGAATIFRELLSTAYYGSSHSSQLSLSDVSEDADYVFDIIQEFLLAQKQGGSE